MIKKVLYFLVKLDFWGKYKEVHEYRYWKSRKSSEGTLLNDHYQRFYTDFFNLSKNFYAGKRLLDIGCGPRGSLEWADCARERIGLDPLAHKYLKLGAKQHKMQYVKGHAEAIPFPGGYFDVVTSFNSLDHVSSVDRTIGEIVRVTKEGGFFLLLTDVNHDPTPAEPHHFGWEIVEKFKPSFIVVHEWHYEKKSGGIYASMVSGELYDHSNFIDRYGILAVVFRRIGLNEIPRTTE